MTGDAARGEGRDIDALLAEHLPGLRGFIRLRSGPQLRSLEETTDLVQSVCREILLHRDRFQFPDEDGFRRWLYTTALRKIGHRAQHYRALKRDVGRTISLEGGRDSAEELLNGYSKVCTPSQVVQAREQVSRIEAAFDQLPEDHREVVTLARIVGLSHTEIAERMGRTESATRSLLFRALERLSELLGDEASPS